MADKPASKKTLMLQDLIVAVLLTRLCLNSPCSDSPWIEVILGASQPDFISAVGEVGSTPGIAALAIVRYRRI